MVLCNCHHQINRCPLANRDTGHPFNRNWPPAICQWPVVCWQHREVNWPMRPPMDAKPPSPNGCSIWHFEGQKRQSGLVNDYPSNGFILIDVWCMMIHSILVHWLITSYVSWSLSTCWYSKTRLYIQYFTLLIVYFIYTSQWIYLSTFPNYTPSSFN